MNKFYVYVLRSKIDGNFYTGFSIDLEKRIEEHNRGEVFSTKHRIPLEIVYYEVSFSRDDATHREKYLKTTYGKRYIKNRIRHFLSKP